MLACWHGSARASGPRVNGTGIESQAIRTFGRWRFHVSTGDLEDGTTTLRLEPQVARLLDYFLIHQQTLISRDTLIGAVWDGRVVSDDAVNRCISILRQKLTPDDRNAYIETVMRRGFISHFPSPIEAVAAPEPDPAQETGPAPGQRRYHAHFWRFGMLAALAGLLLVGIVILRGAGVPPASGTVPVVAVLPFTSVGLSAESDFFARGVHDDLLTQLAQLQSVQVISRTSVSGYGNDGRDIRSIGRELGADAILEGGVQRLGNQIRINVQLIDARADTHLWAAQYDRELTPGNIFSIQTDIARAISAALNATLTRQDMKQLQVLPTQNMAAYRAYHDAIELRKRKPISAPAYLAHLEKAVALDPGFLRAWAELAGALSFANISVRDPAAVKRLEDILERMRAMAPQSSEYLVAQAYYTYYVLKDYERASALIAQARRMRPSDTLVLELQTWIQRRLGDYPGLIGTLREAMSLDPRSEYWVYRLAGNLVVAHRYDEAAAVLDSAPVTTFRQGALASLLRVRQHREPSQLLPELMALQREYNVQAPPAQLWEAHIGARDYRGAMTTLDAMQRDGLNGDDSGDYSSLIDLNLARAITARLQGDDAAIGDLLAAARARVEENQAAGRYAFPPSADLALALLTAPDPREGTARIEQRVRSWQRGASKDLAELTNNRHRACRALAMAGAVSATLECLTSALAAPSLVMPFIEPFLPYYDRIRGDTRFARFLTDLERV